MEKHLKALEQEASVVEKVLAFREGEHSSDCQAELREYQRVIDSLLGMIKEKGEIIEEEQEKLVLKEQEIMFVKKDRDDSVSKLNKIAAEMEVAPRDRRGKLASLCSVSTVSSCHNCVDGTEQVKTEKAKASEIEGKLVDFKLKYAESSSKLMELEDENEILRRKIEVMQEKLETQQSSHDSLENSPRLQTDYNIYRTPKSKSKLRQKQRGLNTMRQPTFD